jgi:hypothetical protein
LLNGNHKGGLLKKRRKGTFFFATVQILLYLCGGKMQTAEKAL